jgi:hypothetical protein
LGIAPAIRGGIVLTLGNAFRMLPVLAYLWLAAAVCGLLVVPAVMVLPALV